MALIKCPECGKEISDKAKTCPKCGWKVNIDEIKKEEVKKDEVLPKKPIEIEASCFEPNIYKSVLNNEKKIQEQAKENQDTRTDLESSPNGEQSKNKIHTDKELAKMAGVESNTVVENETIMKSDSVETDDIKKERKDNKKGKIFKKIVIAVVVLIALGAWSVVLVKMTANMIVKNLDISIESIEVVESDKVVVPKQTNVASIESEVDEVVEKPVEEVVEEVVEEPVKNEIYNGEIVGEIVSGNSGLSENVVFTFIDSTSYGDTKEFHFRITNNSDNEINIGGVGMYINKTSVELAFSDYDSTIPAGYSNVFTFNYFENDVQMTGNVITEIEKGFKNKETDEQFWVRFSGLNIQL